MSTDLSSSRRVLCRVRQRGVTLVELVVFIVVIAIGVSGILSVMTFTTRHSADPMVQEQALLVAEAYMQEILLKPFLDPSAGTTNVCQTPVESNRASYDNICDFNGLNDNGARDQLGKAITGLELYTVAVTVSGGTSLSLGPAANPVNNTGAIRLLQVDVTVSRPPDFSVTLTGYRTSYNCSNAGDAACLPL